MTTQTSRRKFIQAGIMTSIGSFAGVASAAGAPAIKDSSLQNPDNTFDVIVLGCGIAGLVAALQAKAEGASVALFEKMDRPAGNAICALGGFCAWGSRHQIAQGVKDNAKDFYDAMMDISAGRADPALTKTYTDNIPHDTDWLESEFKIPFGKTRTAAYPRLDRVCSIDGQGLTGGANAAFKLLDAAKARGVKFFWEHKAIELLTNDLGHVIGVRVQTPEGKKEFFARGGVCIATGGFSANPEMTDKYIGGWASRLALRGSPYTTGENISLCMPLFAKFVNMDQFHTGPIVSATHVNPNQALNAYHGIIVDVHGKRFTDESNTYVIKSLDCAKKTLENKAWVIVDSKCPTVSKVTKTFQRLNTPYCQAASIEELAKQMNIPAKVLTEAVDSYNNHLKEGTLAQMNPPCTYQKPYSLDKGPFYAFPFEGGMTATFGGPLINTKAEVQNLEGRSIRGLYAAGNAAGGLFFRNYIGGAQFGGATVFGRIAGREMAHRAQELANK